MYSQIHWPQLQSRSMNKFSYSQCGLYDRFLIILILVWDMNSSQANNKIRADLDEQYLDK